MTITIEVDCTPEEARAVLDLPDVDPEALMKTWMPLGLRGLEQAQKMFWSRMGEAAGGAKGGGER